MSSILHGGTYFSCYPCSPIDLPTIVSQQSPVYVVQGLNIQLNCTFQNGFPLATTVTWTYPNGSVVVSQGRFLVQNTNISTSLTISYLVGGGDNGTYACNASNSIGVSSKAVQLFVQSEFRCLHEQIVMVDPMYKCF